MRIGPIGLIGFILTGLVQAQSTGGARILEQAGQFDRALEEYRVVLQKRPDELAAYQGLVRMCRQLQQYDTLEAVSARLAARVPNEAQYALGRIEGLLGLKRRKEALGLGRDAAQKWPRQVEALADLFERGEEPAEAVSYLLVARKGRERDQVLTERLITLYESQGKYVEAVREIAGLVDAEPGRLVVFLERLREYAGRAGGQRMLAELGALADPWSRARAQAEILLAMGRGADALKTARQAMDRDGLYGFAHECEDAGALDVALTVYREQGLRADEARVLRKMGRNKEALVLLADEKNPDVLFELAEIHRLETGDLAAAVAAYEKVLKARPGDEPAAFGLAATQVRMGKPEDARRTIAASRRQTDRLGLLLTRVLFFNLKMDSARQYALEFARRFPDSPLAADGLEIALVCASGERATELARAEYESEKGEYDKSVKRCVALGKGTDDAAEIAWFLRARVERRAGRPRAAVAVLDSFALVFPQSPRQARRLMEQAEVFRYELKDENKYRQALEKVAVSHSGTPYAPVARALLQAANRPTGPEPIR